MDENIKARTYNYTMVISNNNFKVTHSFVGCIQSYEAISNLSATKYTLFA